MIRIGLISDTHGLMRPEALAALEGVDHILHAGDVGAPHVLDALREVAPVTAVRGNVDGGEWAGVLPIAVTLHFAGVAVHLRHILDRSDPEMLAENPRAVIFGHTHKPEISEEDGVLFVNPGAAGPRRFSLPVSVGFLSISYDGGIEPRLLSLSV